MPQSRFHQDPPALGRFQFLRGVSTSSSLELGRSTAWGEQPDERTILLRCYNYSLDIVAHNLSLAGMRGDQVGGPIRWCIHIPASPEQVFAALDSDEGRASFWAESAVEVDGLIHFRFINGFQCESKIVERIAPHVFAIDYMGGLVRFELTPDGVGGTDLLLLHSGIAPEEWIEVHAGWLNVLFPLKAWLGHGVDLRNHDPQRSWDRGYADQ